MNSPLPTTNAPCPDAVIYRRVASADSVAHVGDLLQDQESACRSYAQNEGIRILEVFSDHASGSEAERPGLKAMLAFIRARKGKATLIIVDEISRLARASTLFQKIERDLHAIGGCVKPAAKAPPAAMAWWQS